MVTLASNSDKIIRPQKGSITKEIILVPFRLHAFRKAAITWPSSLLLQNSLRHFVPHVILHLMIYCLRLQRKMAARTVKGEVLFQRNKENQCTAS